MPDNHTLVGISQHSSRGSLGGAKRVGQSQHIQNQELIDRLHDAALSFDQSQCDDAITYGLSQGIRAEVISDHYIPAVARIMGEKWCSDQMSFAYVTIGVSRLQGMLRDLDPTWADDRAAGAGAATVLLAVDDACHHTLGALVLAGQLRRRGISVQILLGSSPAIVKARLRMAKPDAVFISAACGDSLQSIKRIVDAVRECDHADPKVVIGGSILSMTPDIVELTGVDFACNDADEAIAFCALNDHKRAHPKLVRK